MLSALVMQKSGRGAKKMWAADVNCKTMHISHRLDIVQLHTAQSETSHCLSDRNVCLLMSLSLQKVMSNLGTGLWSARPTYPAISAGSVYTSPSPPHMHMLAMYICTVCTNIWPHLGRI